MNATTESTRFTDTESEELSVYRPINRWAIVAAVFGALSAAALLHPALLAFPVIGLASGLFAAWQLASAEATQTGRTAMKWGLFLSLLFGTCATSSMLYRQTRLDNEARRCAEKWLEIFRTGDIRMAHQLTLEDDSRVAAGVSLDQFYDSTKTEADPHQDHGHASGRADPGDPVAMSNATPAEKLKEFMNRPVIVRMAKLKDKAHYTYLDTPRRTPEGTSVLYVEQKYAGEYDEGGQPRRFVVKIVVERRLLNRTATWKISNIEESSDN